MHAKLESAADEIVPGNRAIRARSPAQKGKKLEQHSTCQMGQSYQQPAGGFLQRG